jgi:hypothetical protein
MENVISEHGARSPELVWEAVRTHEDLAAATVAFLNGRVASRDGVSRTVYRKGSTEYVKRRDASSGLYKYVKVGK